MHTIRGEWLVVVCVHEGDHWWRDGHVGVSMSSSEV